MHAKSKHKTCPKLKTVSLTLLTEINSQNITHIILLKQMLTQIQLETRGDLKIYHKL